MQYILSKAKIYGRDPERKLTKYEQSINDTAAQIALENPDMLLSKQKLLEEARKKLNDSGYDYKKGKSRSKQLKSSSESDESTPAPKRVKTTEALRLNRMSEIEEDLSDISQRMGFKEKRREQASLSHQYGICDQISEEISVLKDRRRVLEKELNALKKKEQQSKWYKKKSKLRSTSSSSGTMKRISSSESEDQQAVPPFSVSETLTSGSLTYSQATVTENQSLLDVLNSAIEKTVSPTSPSISRDHTISPSPEPRASSDSPSLADLITSAIDSDVFPPSPSVSPSPQTPASSGSRSFAELVYSAIAGDTSSTSGTLSVCEEMGDSSVSSDNLNHFQ